VLDGSGRGCDPSSQQCCGRRYWRGTTPAACTTPGIVGSPDFYSCLTSQGIKEAISYQPARRYWPFQWTETALYLAAAAALAGYCFRRLSRRLA
jgi:hypothetical protein